MVYQTRNIITEAERKNIKSLYGLDTKSSYVFEAHISINGRYLVIQDEVYDLVEDKNYGNLWGSIDTFKMIFENIQGDNKEYMDLRENILKTPILESRQNLNEVRDILLEFDFMQDTWLGKSLSDAGKGITDTFNQAKAGLEKMGSAISQGQWSEILRLFGQGILFVLRKLKDALYSNVGMIVDGILFATEIGKTVQWMPWALVVALDIYQMITGNYPEEEMNQSPWMRALFFGFDILGLVSTAAVAKTARAAALPMKTLRTDAEIAGYLEKTPALKNTLQSMQAGIKKVPSYLESASKIMAEKFPAGTKFLNSIFGKMSDVLKGTEESLAKVMGQKAATGVMGGVKTGGVLYGFDKGANFATKLKTGLNDVQIKNLETMNNVLQKTYKGRDPFE